MDNVLTKTNKMFIKTNEVIYMDKLDITIEKICDFKDENNTFEFYMRIINCIDECINLLIDMDLFLTELINRKITAKNIWGNKYDKELLHELHTINGKEQIKYEFTDKKYYVYGALNFYLDSFEEWPDDERANSLEYFVFVLVKIGINKEEIYKIIKKHFMEFIE
jgi:hypothetical protein